MFAARSNFSRFSVNLSVFTLLVCFAATMIVRGGTERSAPERGFNPGNSYQMSEIETISQQSGNLMLNLPLGSLPSGRGGMSAGLSLHYNSKLWDLMTSDVDGLNVKTVDLSFDNFDSNGAAVGGWRYASYYKLEYEMYGAAKIQLVTPDGSRHLLWLAGKTNSDGGIGYFPDGRPAFSQFPALASSPVFFTVDGTFLRVEVEADGDTNWGNNRYTIYQPDGTRIVLNPDAAQPDVKQRVIDRNGNAVDWIEKASNPAFSNHRTTTLADSVGRMVTVEYEAAVNEDRVHSAGVDGASVVTRVLWKTVHVRRRYTIGTQAESCPAGNCYLWLNQSLRVVDRIYLPNQIAGGALYYDFDYLANDEASSENSSPGWGEVKQVTLPSKARSVYEYSRDAASHVIRAGGIVGNRPVKKQLFYHEQYDGAAATLKTDEWTYAAATTNDFTMETPAWTSVTAPDGSVTTDYYQTIPGLTNLPSPHYLGMSKESFKTVAADGTTVEKIYASNAPTEDAALALANRFVKYELVTLADAAGAATKTAIKEFAQDKNGNSRLVKEYDFVAASVVPRDANGRPTGLPANLTPARVSATEYYAETPDSAAADYADPDAYQLSTAPRLRGSVKATEIRNGTTNAVVSRSEIGYDDAANTGNATLSKTWDSSKGAISTPLTAANSVQTTAQYNAYGMPTLTTDARGVQTEIIYGDISTGSGTINNLYPTETRAAANYAALKRTIALEYDFRTGLVKKTTDVDNNVSSETIYDALGRAVISKTATGRPEEIWTQMQYDDAARRVISKADLFTKGDGLKIGVQHFDELGRVCLSRRLENAATEDPLNEAHGVKVQTRYQTGNPHSYQLTSNPYRAATSAQATAEAEMGWTRSKSANTGRHSEVETFSGAALPAPWGTNTNSTGRVQTDTDANRTLVTDQAGKRRISETNALGQLKKVWEIKTQDADTENISFGNPAMNLNGLVTSYSYDTLSNLTIVNQGVQTRTFAYNSLSRLTSATNPESGTISYNYDSNGNLLKKTDARSIETNYGYDLLNRVLTRGYTDGVTPQTSYLYDNLPNAKGQLIEVDNTVSKTRYTAFDGIGRVTASEQTTTGDAQTRAFGYQYNLSGAMVAQTYPSGRVVRNELDADGELLRVTSQKNANTAQRLMASSFVKTAAGAVSSMRLGNGRWENTTFNSRMQPVQMGLGSGATEASAWKVEFDYGATQNNGNILSQKITVPTVGTNQGFTANQNYSYDSLNRLSSAVETIGEAQTWKQSYAFDRFGNRKLNYAANATTFPAANQGLPKVVNPEADINTNRLKSDQDGDNVADYIFDAAGNLTRDAEGRQFIYDGENKQKEVKSASNETVGTYFYDGDGKRVKKINNQTGEVTIFVYDAAGKLSAEYSNNVAANSAPQTSYLTNDHLGSPRVITDAQGRVTSRRDFLPFGEDVATPQRTTELGYQLDTIRQGFTGYEKDDESGLEYAQARFYNTKHGRFHSPDEPLNDQWEDEPQTWNLYSYVTNQPLLFQDTTGKWKETPCTSGGQDRTCFESDREDDTYQTLAELAGLPAQFVAEFFSNQDIPIGQIFDLHGFDHWLQEDFSARVVTSEEANKSHYRFEMNVSPPFKLGTITKLPKLNLLGRLNKLSQHASQWGLGIKGKALTQMQLLAMKKVARRIVRNAKKPGGEVRQGEWANPAAGGYKDALFFSDGKNIVVTKQDGTLITILKNGTGNKHFNNATKVP